MKKISCIIILFIILVSISASAEEEITFHDIPWLSDEFTTVEILYNAGLIRDKTLSNLSNENNIIITTNEAGFIMPFRECDNEDTCISASFNSSVKGRIAGYPLKDMVLTFAYNGDLQLIAVKVVLLGASYDMLEMKLEKVYGEPVHLYDDEGLETYVWKGYNNSGVILYTSSEGEKYDLVYGRLDAIDILSTIIQTDANDVSGL